MYIFTKKYLQKKKRKENNIENNNIDKVQNKFNS